MKSLLILLSFSFFGLSQGLCQETNADEWVQTHPEVAVSKIKEMVSENAIGLKSENESCLIQYQLRSKNFQASFKDSQGQVLGSVHFPLDRPIMVRTIVRESSVETWFLVFHHFQTSLLSVTTHGSSATEMKIYADAPMGIIPKTFVSCQFQK